MPFDLLAIDLDGTLLRCDGTVSPETIRALRRARAAGLEIVIATGRALIESAHVLQEIGHGGAFIGAGGALLSRANDGATLERSAMAPGLIATITRSLTAHGHLAHLLKDGAAAGYDYAIIGNGILDPASEWWFRTLPVRVRFFDSPDEDPHPEETIRCGTVAAEGDLSGLAEEIRTDLGEAIFLQHWSAVTQGQATGSQTHLLEIFNPEVDKWTMLHRYAERRGISIERIAAIGDGLNDRRMIRNAGLGVAMGNADSGVLEAADRVVADNEAEGVAEAIAGILRGGW